jgi:hypothetical protein
VISIHSVTGAVTSSPENEIEKLCPVLWYVSSLLVHAVAQPVLH